MVIVEMTEMVEMMAILVEAMNNTVSLVVFFSLMYCMHERLWVASSNEITFVAASPVRSCRRFLDISANGNL